jgi:hypothetical protein
VCGRKGRYYVTRPLAELTPPEALEAVELSHLVAETGALPAGGGLLDQTASFLSAHLEITAQRARLGQGSADRAVARLLGG